MLRCFDGNAAVPLLKPLPPPKKLLADKAYDCAGFRAWLSRRGTTPVIPNKINRRKPYPHNKRAYRHRDKIERMFCRLQRRPAHRNTLRQIRQQLPQRGLPRRSNLLLVTISLDPSQPYSMPAVAPSAFNTDTPIISIYGTFSTQFALVPVKTVAPVISGTAQVRQTLTATAGTWANTPTSYAYQWNRGGTAINGAASSTYVPVAADVGNTLTVSVIATNGSGSSAPATSAPTAAVTSSSAIWPAANYANQGARGFNQPGDNSLGSYQAAAAYGANVMRVFINGNTGGGTNNLSDNGSQYRIGNGAYGTFDFTALDAIAANAQAAGAEVIWVIDDGKDLFTSSSLQNSFIAMWQAIATHYKAGTPYATTIVGYDLWNEPAINGSQAQWIPLSQNTASAIRAIDPDHVLIWEPFPWGLPYSYDGITTMPLAAFSNVVYSFHAYDPHLFTNNGVGIPTA